MMLELRPVALGRQAAHGAAHKAETEAKAEAEAAAEPEAGIFPFS